MEDHRNWALAEIGRQPLPPSPIQAVAFGVYCKIEWWVTNGFRDLVTYPCCNIDTISGPIANLLSMDMYMHIVSTIDKIRRIRINVGHTVCDYQPASNCAREAAVCKAAWYCHVGAPFQLRYQSPQRPLMALFAADWVVGRKVPGICMPCMLQNKGRLASTSPMWTFEEYTINTALAVLVSAMTP